MVEPPLVATTEVIREYLFYVKKEYMMYASGDWGTVGTHSYTDN